MNMFLLVKLHIDMGLEAVLPGPQNALYIIIIIIIIKTIYNAHIVNG